MLYTGKGDSGSTGIFGSKTRVSKSSLRTEALGSLDELNSFLGLCKIKSAAMHWLVGEEKVAEAVHRVQMNLFICQAELAGAEKTITEEKVKALGETINGIEKELPPIKSFFVSGGTELAALFDVARTIARRAERRAVAANEEHLAAEKKPLLGANTLAYLNRLSSLLYALARLTNHRSGIKEQSPDYR